MLIRLSLGELRSTTCGFETVLFTLFHSRITCEESCFLELRTKFCVELKKSSCDSVTDSTGLTGDSAAVYVADDIEL